MPVTEPFSQRHGYVEPEPEITVRAGEPGALRTALPGIAYDCGLTPTNLREIVCRVLEVEPDSYNWTDFPNVDGEVRELLGECQWFYVYDVIERVLSSTLRHLMAEDFAERLNAYFRRRGYGWQIANGLVEVRGTEAFEVPVRGALDELAQSGRVTAHSELQEALGDISRRPEPDVTGAIQHSIAALECLARDISGGGNDTLGDLVKKHPELFPSPLGEAVHKLWGYASNKARHLKEGSAAEFEESEFVVHLASALCGYLMHKFDGGNRSSAADDLDDLPFE